MVAQVCEYIKNHLIVTLNEWNIWCVNYILFNLLFTKKLN